MNVIYKLFDPTSGEYIPLSSRDKLIDRLAQESFNLYMQHTHSSPVAVVTILEDGTEIWRNLEGETTINYDEYIKQFKLKVGAKLSSIEQTKVEVLP